MNNSADIIPVKPDMYATFLDLRRKSDVVIPEGVREIGEKWFKGADVESVTIPVSVAVIGKEAFHGCGRLKRVIFVPGSRLEKIGSACFSNSGIERITVPKGVEEIPKSAFEECTNLQEVAFEEGSRLTTIEEKAFYECRDLVAITLPEKL